MTLQISEVGRVTAISVQIHFSLSGNAWPLVISSSAFLDCYHALPSPITLPGLLVNFSLHSCLLRTGMSGVVDLALAPDHLVLVVPYL